MSHTHNNCNCSNITTNPCTSGTGCLTTNYGKCIYYSGDLLASSISLESGENLDVAIERIVAALDALTPADLSWNTFDYDCLGPYATAQEFAEGVSAALCTLTTRVDDIDTVTFSIETCGPFTTGPYSLVGSLTLDEILHKFMYVICNLWNDSGSEISVSNGCFTDNTGIATMEDWLAWVVSNTCSIKTSLTATINALDTRVGNVEDYLGTASQLSTRHDNSDCLSGGSTDTAYDTIQLLKTKICALNTSLAAIPDLSAITLSWNPCYGYGNTASLSTQLGRIVSVLKLQKYNFDAGDFNVVSTACGDTISLVSGATFTCADLASCSLLNIGDVNGSMTLNSGTCGYALKWDNANSYFTIKADSVFTNIGRVGKTGLYTAESSGFYFKEPTASADCSDSTNYSIGFVEDTWIDLTSYLGTYVSAGSFAPSIMKTWDGQIRFRGTFQSNAAHALGAAGQPLNVDAGIRLFTAIPTAYRPTVLTTISVPIGYINIGSAPNSFYLMGQLIFDPATGHVQLYTRDQGYLLANIDGAAGTDEYLGNYAGSLQGLVINY